MGTVDLVLARIKLGRAWRTLRRALRERRRRRLPAAVWIAMGLLALAAANAAYHATRKPTEVLGVVVPSSPKSPAETWAAYSTWFRASSTDIVTPDLLAALAQLESSGDPLARTYWRWRWSWNPLVVYGPASSAVGLMQMTDGTFARARRLCIRDHAVARDGPWWDPRSCWGNAFYFRAIPSHSIEMTAAYLHQSVVDTLFAERLAHEPLEAKQRLATVIHLCGPERGAAYARRGFRALPGERCGDHDVGAYVAREQGLQRTFARIEAAGGG